MRLPSFGDGSEDVMWFLRNRRNFSNMALAMSVNIMSKCCSFVVSTITAYNCLSIIVSTMTVSL